MHIVCIFTLQWADAYTLWEIKKSFFVTINYKLIKTISNKRKVIDFLPSCNLIIKREIFDNCQFMNSNLFVHEDVALNESIKKKTI